MASLLKNLAEPHNPNKQYKSGDIVVRSGKLYLCTEDTSGAFDISAWEEKYLTDLVRGSALEDFSGVTVDAGDITSDGERTFIKIPRKGIYDENSMLQTLNSNLDKYEYYEFNAKDGYTLTLPKKPKLLVAYNTGNDNTQSRISCYIKLGFESIFTEDKIIAYDFVSSGGVLYSMNTATNYCIKNIDDNGNVVFNKFPNFPNVKVWVQY